MKFTFLFSFLLLTTPLLVHAVEITYTPLSPIPGLTGSGDINLIEYINNVFTLIISVAAMIAVLRIVTGGFKYIIEESVGGKSEARGVIQGAVIGLILLLGSWLILNVINPNITNLDALRFDTLKPSPTEQAKINQFLKDRADAEQKRKDDIATLTTGTQTIVDPVLGLDTTGGVVDVSSLNKSERTKRAKACSKVGRTPRYETRLRCKTETTTYLGSSSSCFLGLGKNNGVPTGATQTLLFCETQ